MTIDTLSCLIFTLMILFEAGCIHAFLCITLCCGVTPFQWKNKRREFYSVNQHKKMGFTFFLLKFIYDLI